MLAVSQVANVEESDAEASHDVSEKSTVVGALEEDESPMPGNSAEKSKAAALSGDNVTVDDGYLLTRENDVIWVDFALVSAHDPMQFSRGRKWAITVVVCILTFWTSFNVSSYAIGQTSMSAELHATPLQSAFGITIYAWGFSFFPLVLAPISEQFGRRPMFLIAGFLWWLFYFPQAGAHSIAVILVFRFLQGGAGSVGATISSGVLADIWATSERGSKMSMYAVAAVIGSGLAPMGMSWVEMNSHLQWRWIQWIEVIVTTAYLPSIPLVLKETRSGLLLERAAARFNKESKAGEGVTYMARSEIGKLGMWEKVKISCTRPIVFLFTEPIVLFVTIWISVAWGVLFGEIQSIPFVFQKLYHFNLGQTGLVYASLVVGTILAAFLNIYQERLYARNIERRGAEARLYLAMAGGILFSVGAFIFAWTSFPNVHWIAPCIGITVMICGIFSIYLAVFNYMADAYTIYASSALAGQSFLRNLLAGTFPTWIIQTYENLGINYAGTLFGCLAVALAFVPFVAFFYGPKIRAKSRFSKQIIADQEALAKLKLEAEAKMNPTSV